MRFKLGVIVGGGIGYLIASGRARELVDEATTAVKGRRKGTTVTVDVPREPSDSTPWASRAVGEPLAPVT